jgi:hypothetical protein
VKNKTAITPAINNFLEIVAFLFLRIKAIKKHPIIQIIGDISKSRILERTKNIMFVRMLMI